MCRTWCPGRELELGPQAPVFGPREFAGEGTLGLQGDAGDLPARQASFARGAVKSQIAHARILPLGPGGLP